MSDAALIVERHFSQLDIPPQLYMPPKEPRANLHIHNREARRLRGWQHILVVLCSLVTDFSCYNFESSFVLFIARVSRSFRLRYTHRLAGFSFPPEKKNRESIII